jgi:hypothetical protein
MSEKYSFVTGWRIEAPIEKVWDAIYESTEWPTWWKGVKDVKVVEENDASGVNGVREYTWKSVLPYTLKFKLRLVERDDPGYMRGLAFGELEGMGIWRLREQDGVTSVEYNWDVVTTKAWMNYLSFLLKPLFKYNHDVVMRWGAKGLAKKLNAPLLSY